MDNRKSDTSIIPKKLLITVEGRDVHFIASSKSESCRRRRADIMVNELLGIQYNIAKANVTVKPDIIILGIPGGIMPINKYLHNYFGEFTYMVCNALKVDIGILCSYYAQNIDSGYVSEIERLCAYRYNIPQVNFYISENKMKTDSENKLEIGIYRLGKNIIDSLNISNHNLQNVKSCFDNNNSLEELWYQVECKLAENVECIV